MNKVILIGRLGKDPEINYMPNGKAICKFSIATQDTKDNPTWHNITTFENTAEIAAKYLKKGSQVAVDGRINYSQSEKDGVKRYYTDIIVSRLELLGSKPEQEERRPPQNNDDYAPPSDFGDDIPF